MQVILSSNIPHYYFAALALQEASYLKKYICAIATRGASSPIRSLLPPYWKRKLQGRDVSLLEPSSLHSLWLPELLQRGLTRSRLLSMERGNWLCNHLYDWMASHHVDGPDIFHFSSSIGLYSARRAKAQGAIIICDARTEFPDYQRQLLRPEYQMLGLPYEPSGLLYDRKVNDEFAIADYLIVPSNYARDTYIRAGFNRERIFTVPYGVELDNISRRDDPTTGIHPGGSQPFRIIFAGQLIPRKGIHYLLSAFESLDIPDSELLLLGRIDASLADRVKKAVMQNPNIRALGSVPKVDLDSYFRTGSVFVLPSLADSWGLVTAEAMASGLPVIVTRNAGSSEMVRNGTDGFVIPARNPSAIAEKIKFLYEHPTVRIEMSMHARSRVKEFTWRQYQRHLLDVYEEIRVREGSERSWSQ